MSSGFGAKIKGENSRIGVSHLNDKNAQARTGMPSGLINKADNKPLSGDFSSAQSKNIAPRQTILSSGANGTGLWVHQTASSTKIEAGNNLPPIKNGSIRGTP